jgi:ElaB/YqjD/DUF883 family membrane-anchored ribosome-binding protein
VLPGGEAFIFHGVIVMAEETSPIDREPKPLPRGVEEPRASLVDKLGTLEEGIKDAWHGATAAATRAVEGVKAATETTVHAVHGAAETTAHAVQGAAHSTSEAMGRAFDLRAHVRRHPWPMVGGALLLGVAAGYLVGRLRR